MSDVFVPGVRSRFNSEKLIEDLMKVERIPRDRVEQNIGSLETQKGYWQEVGRRITSLRDSARFLYSFQNPFNERTAISSDSSVLSASATREASQGEYRFSVKQMAQADRFLSAPLEENYKVESGTYTFSVGKEEVSFNFRGGSLREFAEALNRRGRDKISASLITVQPGSKSFLIESKLTGAENRLGFSDDSTDLAIRMGIIGPGDNNLNIQDDTLEVPAQASSSIPFLLNVQHGSPMVLQFDTSTGDLAEENIEPQPPPGPDTPSSGAVSWGNFYVENDPSTAPLPEWNPDIPERVDTMTVLSLTFSDGSKAQLPPIADTGSFFTQQFPLAEIAAGKTITTLNIENTNTHRNISIRNIMAFDSNAANGGLVPLNPVSTAQDAIISMEGIEMIRPKNTISDIIPGVTVTARGVSERPVQLTVQADHEAVKSAVISLVGNYNRLMAEINVLTRADDRLVDELSYLNEDEAAAMRQRLGAFSGDSTLNQFKSNLQRTVSAPYPTDEEQSLALLSQIGISTNTRSSGGAGYDPSRLRGYLEIDEKVLDAAIETHLSAIRQLFGSDTDGDLLVDTGVAFNLETLSKPFVEIGGIISLKSGTLDSRISQDRRRVDSMERQLLAKEAELRVQYSRMESAYARMEQMSNSFENFRQQTNNNR
ncbi:MAG: flagellar filament capping protein FliD [Treponema sp.]|jgi:flagellar hook-associated protein 2|nr:flagellar filament capping protein FliD [Treponema sp.]